jgi:hypothetical protein
MFRFRNLRKSVCDGTDCEIIPLIVYMLGSGR